MRAQRIAAIRLDYEQVKDSVGWRWGEPAGKPAEVPSGQSDASRVPVVEVREFYPQQRRMKLVHSRDGAVQLADVLVAPAVHAQQPRGVGNPRIRRQQRAGVAE